MQRIIASTICVLFFVAAGGQCLEKDSLIKRLTSLPSSDIPLKELKEQLKELSRYEAMIGSCAYQYDAVHVMLLRRIGWNYYLQTDYLQAVNYYRRAIDLFEKSGIVVSHSHKLSAYFLLAEIYGALRDVSSRLKMLNRCIELAAEYNRTTDVSCLRSLYARAEYYFDIGDYHRCIRDARDCEMRGLEYLRSPNTTDRDYIQKVVFSSAGWYVNAQLILGNYALLEKYLESQVQTYKADTNTRYLGLTYAQLGELHANKENYEKAIGFYQRSFNCFRDAKDSLRCKQVLNEFGHDVYFRRLKDDEKALACYRRALRYHNTREKKEDTAETLNIYANIANVHVRKGRFDSAFFYFQRAFDQVKQGKTEDYILQVPIEEKKSYKKIHFLASLVMDKADAYWQQFKTTGNKAALTEAIRIYKMADRLLNSIKVEQGELESKLFWRNDTRRLYEHAIEACNAQHNNDDAFYFFEKSRAVLLNDQLMAQNWLGGEDISRQVAVQKKLLQIERLMNDLAPGSIQYAQLEDERFRYRNELARLEQLVKERNPFYYQRVLDTSFITLQQVQAMLATQQQSLVEIFEGESAVYCLLVTPNSCTLNKIDKTVFTHVSASFLLYVSKDALANKDFAGYTKTAHQLYQLIFQNNPLPEGRIIVSPDQHYFPFEALITNTGGPAPVYFLDHYAVSYTYSARYLQNVFPAGKSVTDGYLLGVAPVNYAPSLKLRPLDGSDASLNRISRYFKKSNNLLGADATRNNFLNQFANYRIIQLYTHAADSSSNKEPVIYFADSSLFLSDLIPGHRPATRLIVLSACETGGGRIYQGEGVFSFNRGFAALGIPSAVTNLWIADNQATYRLTELFYKQLSKNLPLDVAMQQARIMFIKTASGEEALPYYWAAAIIVGKTDPIQLNASTNRVPLALIIGAGVVLFLITMVYIKKRFY